MKVCNNFETGKPGNKKLKTGKTGFRKTGKTGNRKTEKPGIQFFDNFSLFRLILVTEIIYEQNEFNLDQCALFLNIANIALPISRYCDIKI